MFADEFKKIRKSRGFTQQTLADAIGVKRQSVQKWESGDGYPDRKRWQSIEAALDVMEGWVASWLSGHNETAKSIKIYGNGNTAQSAQAGGNVFQSGGESHGGRNKEPCRPTDQHTHLKLIVEWINERAEADPTDGMIFFEQLKEAFPDFKSWLNQRLNLNSN